MSRVNGVPADNLFDPTSNIAFGQSFIEAMRGSSATQGQLPKIIAAYNAGPLPVARWSAYLPGTGDPLLWIESIPYWETRYYVPSVFRNLWVYQGLAGAPIWWGVCEVPGWGAELPPDRLGGASPEERQRSAERFARLSEAYHRLV